VINGTVAIMNTLQLDQLSGVQKITGGLSIAANLGTIPQLACLEEVKSLTLSSGNDYSALQALRTLESLAVWGGPETVFPPAFTEVQQIDRIELVYVDAILGFPQVDQLGSLSLTSAPAPTFAETFALDSLFMNEEQKDTSGLDGVVVQRFSVSGYAGTSLPLVSVEQSLDIYQAPNLTVLSVELPPTFPAQAPENYDDEGNSRLYIHGTALTSLDELTGISVYTTRPGFVQNPNLVDVSGLTGAAVMLAYELPPNTGGGLGISESPQLCLSHAQMVIDTMTLPKPAQFYALDEDC